MIIGQDKLIKKIDNMSMDKFPRSLLIVGKEGSGKHLIADYIVKKLSLKCLDITEDLTLETIEDISLRVEPYVYLINASKISVKEENVILKFLEEPLKNSYVILLCNSKNLLLPTIINRCQTWQLETYKKEVLETFITQECNKEVILEIADTPGKVKQLQNYNVDVILELANKIFDKIGKANFSNTLTISNKIAFKDEVEKYNFNLFVDVLMYSIKNKIMTDSNPVLIEYYKLTSELANNRNIPHVSLRPLFEKYLLGLRMVSN